MHGFVTHIEKDAVENTNFRKVLYTASHSQLVLMSLKPNEEIGMACIGWVEDKAQEYPANT